MSQETPHTDPFFHFREKIAAGGLCIGPGITLTDPRVTDALGDSVDYIWIDLEAVRSVGQSMAACTSTARLKSNSLRCWRFSVSRYCCTGRSITTSRSR